MWPRTDIAPGPTPDAAGSRRGKSTGLNGFVSFMNRSDAEEALREFDGFEWGGSVLRVGWSKAVPVAAKALYRMYRTLLFDSMSDFEDFAKLQAELEKIGAGVDMGAAGVILVNVIALVLVTAIIVALGAREVHQETDAAHGLVGGTPTAGHDDITVVPAVVLVDAILVAQCMKMLTLLLIHLSGPWLLKSKVMTQNMRKLCANLKRTIQSTILFSIEMWVILAL